MELFFVFLIFNQETETFSVNIDDFQAFIITQQLSQFRDVNIHTSCGEIIFFLPDFPQGQISRHEIVTVHTKKLQ